MPEILLEIIKGTSLFPHRRRVRLLDGPSPPVPILGILRCDIQSSHVLVQSVEPAFFGPAAWSLTSSVDTECSSHDRLVAPPHHVAEPSEAGFLHLRLDRCNLQ